MAYRMKTKSVKYSDVKSDLEIMKLKGNRYLLMHNKKYWGIYNLRGENLVKEK